MYVCDTDRVGVWKMRITIDRRESSAACEPRKRKTETAAAMTMGNFVVNLRFDTFDQLRYFDESRTTANHNREPRPPLFLKSFMFSKLCASLPLTPLWRHLYYVSTNVSTSREKSKRENEFFQKGRNTIFISGNEILVILHFTNVLTICFSAHKKDDEIWVWFHWISLEYYFILSWKKYCSEFSWVLFRSIFEENIIWTIINDA